MKRGRAMQAIACELCVALSLLVMAASAAADRPGGREPMAEVNGEAITADAVDTAIGAPLRRLEEQVYALRRQKLDALILERMLAQEAGKRGMSVQALLDAESAVEPVTEDEVNAAYEAQKNRVTGDPA